MSNFSDISVGSKFYHNNYTTAHGLSLPDYLIVTDIHNGFVTAKYENHYVYTKERVFGFENLWQESNLNPKVEDPEWIFVNAA